MQNKLMTSNRKNVPQGQAGELVAPNHYLSDSRRQLGERLEFHEAKSWRSCYGSASPQAIRTCALQVAEIGTAQMTIAANIDVLAFNRVIGLGLLRPASQEQIQAIVRRYREAGASRFFVQLSPQATPPDLPRLLEQHGFRHYNNWAKLFCRIAPPPVVKTDLRIKRIDRSQADLFAEIIVTCFDWPAPVKSLIAAPVGRRGWKHYIAYAGKTPVACAASYIEGDLGALSLAATLPSARGRGAQSALIARRIYDYADAGCRWLIAETAEETPDRPVTSYRNLRRFGFELAYLRPNYLYEAGPA